MSLIPSESASFPDLLGRRLGASKKSNWRLPVVPEAEQKPPPKAEPEAPSQPPPASPPAGRQSFPKPAPAVAPPAPAAAASPPLPVREAPAQALHPVPLPPIPSARGPVDPAPPARVEERKAIKSPPRVLETERQRMAATEAGRSVVPAPRMPLAKPRQRPRPVLQPRAWDPPAQAKTAPGIFGAKQNAGNVRPESRKSAPPSSDVQPYLPLKPMDGGPEDETLWDDPVPWPNLPRRQRAKMIRFLIIEAIALLILIVSVNVALSNRAPDDWIAVVAKAMTIAMAIVLAVVPILFFGLPKTLPRDRP
jgi:hypothetical protein